MPLTDDPPVDDEEVSLSNSSLGSSDTSLDYEEEEGETVLTSSSFGEGEERNSDEEKRNDHAPSVPPKPRCQRLDRASAHAIGHGRHEYEKATLLLDQKKVPLEGVRSTLTAEVLHQHVLLSQACLELLEERDRYDAIRRLHLRRSLRCTAKEDDVEEDEVYPLLSLIKGGPLYKRHVKGGKTTQKIKSGKDKIKSKLTRSSSDNVVRSAVMESSLLTTWKHKYVEVRKGMLSYWQQMNATLVRKNVTLEASTSVCRAINLEEEGNIEYPFETKETISSSLSSSLPLKSGKKKKFHLYAFELVVNGESRVWACRSEAGRQSWIQAINRGFLGCKINQRKDPNTEPQMQQFLALSDKVKSALPTGQKFSALWGTSVVVPFKSLFADENMKVDNHPAPLECFWSNLETLDIALNGHLFRASSLCCPQRVFGFLARSIRSTAMVQTDQSIFISEIHASKHARDVMRAVGNHDKKMRYLRASVSALCVDENDTVTIEVVHDEPQIVKISVTRPQASVVHSKFSVDRREWIHLRTKTDEHPKRYFAVLSVGVLCFYTEELPRPHRLKGQLLLVGAELGSEENEHIESTPQANYNEDLSSQSSGYFSSNDTPPASRPNYILYIRGREAGKLVEKQLCFTKHDTFLLWRGALINAIESCSPPCKEFSFDGDDCQADLSSTTQPHTFGTMSDDIHVRSSRLPGVRLAPHFFGRLPPLQMPSPKMGINSERKQSYPASLLSSAASVASRRLSRKMLPLRNSSRDSLTQTIAEDAPEKPSSSTISIEVSTSSLNRVFLKGAVEPCTCTIRATYMETFTCSGDKRGRLETKNELIKLETLKGRVNGFAFEMAFDSTSVPPRRRKTI